jgi:cell division protein FtsW (lipid II flippase)
MQPALSVMQFNTIFVFVCLVTLVMAITAMMHHYIMKHMTAIHQFPHAYLDSAGVHLDMSLRAKPVC